MKKAFTLIELLVVVLIIGILSAIALPQYKTAVAKSRTATMLPLLKNLAEAQEVYYMDHGDYAYKLADLDVQLPASCHHVDHTNYDTTGRGELVSCDNYFLIDNYKEEGSVNANYCPGGTAAWATCGPTRDFQILFRLRHNTYSERQNERACASVGSSKLGKAVCSAFGGLKYVSF